MIKLIAIVGPTASGKSTLGIKLAKKFHGEIISADSRQVYKGMDIGAGKVSKQEQRLVKHHLLDVVSPAKQFSVAEFKNLGFKAIEKISKAKKIPFIVGGTAFYVYGLIDNLEFPKVKPNLKLRKTLGNKSSNELFAMLKKLDPARAKNIDKHNPVRLIRAIEINLVSGKSVPQVPNRSPYSTLILGVNHAPDKLRKLINLRVDQRLKSGMINEVKKLKTKKISTKRLNQIGLTYAIVAQYLNKKISKPEMADKIKIAEYQFAKRQMTWFKRDPRIHWVTNQTMAEKLIKKFLQE
jgi:tRNA dimethylallyltransferase